MKKGTASLNSMEYLKKRKNFLSCYIAEDKNVYLR